MSGIDVTSITARNLAAVQELYEAFGRGDVTAVVGALADDVQWEPWEQNFAQRANVPWLAPRSGRDGAAALFGIVGAFEIHDFQVRSLMAGGDQVAAEVLIDATNPAGGRLRDEELHVWTFDAAGQITRLRHYVDTAKHIAAAGGADTTAV